MAGASPPAARTGGSGAGGLPDARLRLDTTVQPPRLALSGGWTQPDGLPDAQAVAGRLAPGSDLVLTAGPIDRWDTTLAAFVRTLEQAVAARGGRLRTEALPQGLERLLRLVRAQRGAVAEPAQPAAGVTGMVGEAGAAGATGTNGLVGAGATAGAAGASAAPAASPRRLATGLLVAAGRPATHAVARASAWMELAGRIGTAFVRLATGRARVPWSDVLEQLVECGPRALPIVTLLSFLIGAITAFVGVVQLRMFNAELYVADLVGMGMLLEMGALMTGVIMAGRAGAAFAAALGTMQTNEEVDALTTLGLDPVEFLVLPRVLALAAMTPLLTLYADLVGIVGGAAVASLMLDMAASTYFNEVAQAVELSQAVKGLIKSFAFGLAIGFAGCLRGIESGRSAQAVGQATTSAVVTSIVLLVLLDAFLTMLYFIYDGQL